MFRLIWMLKRFFLWITTESRDADSLSVSSFTNKKMFLITRLFVANDNPIFIILFAQNPNGNWIVFWLGFYVIQLVVWHQWKFSFLFDLNYLDQMIIFGEVAKKIEKKIANQHRNSIHELIQRESVFQTFWSKFGTIFRNFSNQLSLSTLFDYFFIFLLYANCYTSIAHPTTIWKYKFNSNLKW